MSKKNEKRICWNCEGEVSQHIAKCPYCGVNVEEPLAKDENVFKGFNSPFQRASQNEIPQPPYARVQVTEAEWQAALNEDKIKQEEKNPATSNKREMNAFLLLFPGVIFFLFGLVLTLFSRQGVFTLQWNQDLAYFYFLGSAPLLYLSWRSLRK